MVESIVPSTRFRPMSTTADADNWVPCAPWRRETPDPCEADLRVEVRPLSTCPAWRVFGDPARLPGGEPRTAPDRPGA